MFDKFSIDKDSKGAILITGTSSGIGRACVLKIAKMNYHVFAGVRSEKDANFFLKDSKLSNITPLILDIEKEETIEKSFQYVENVLGRRGLCGLINNAGIAVAVPLEILPLDLFRKQLNVNVTGQLAIIQKFLPLIRKEKGRIINMSSDSGKLTWPYMAAYCASKHAIESLSDGLRMELIPWKIKVILIQPGCIKTKIWNKAQDNGYKFLNESSAQNLKLYETPMKSMLKLAKVLEKTSISPNSVASTVVKALTKKTPKTRYVVGIDAKIQILLTRFLPTCLRDNFILWSIKKLSGCKRN